MKKLVFLIISLHFAFGSLWAQSLSNEEKERIAANIRSKTEDDVRKLFNSNGFTVLNFIKGYPECLDGYVIYSDYMEAEGKGIKMSSQKVFVFENGKIRDPYDKLTGEIVFTITAKENDISSDCIIFICANGWSYILNLYKLDKVNPLFFICRTTLFSFNELGEPIKYAIAGNNRMGNNSTYNFSGFDKDLNCKVIPKPSIEWVEIPAGTFLMGSSKKEIKKYDTRREEQRQVTVDSFKISKYEITFDQYEQFCNATNRPIPNDGGWGKEKMPVINISFEDATAFAEWMGCRLPTEAEWEYACRAGTTTSFNTGDCINLDLANFTCSGPCCNDKYSKGKPVQIGSYPPNKWGLYDMHGNVAEWTCDAMSFEYNTNPQKNPVVPITKESLGAMIKGGGFISEIGYVRSGARCHSPLYDGSTNPIFRQPKKYNWIGIRLVCKQNASR